MSLDYAGEQPLPDNQSLAGAHARIDANSARLTEVEREVGGLRGRMVTVEDGFNSLKNQLSEIKGANEANKNTLMTAIANSDEKGQKIFQGITNLVESSTLATDTRFNLLYSALGLDPEKPQEAGQDYQKMLDGGRKRIKMMDGIKQKVAEYLVIAVLAGIVGLILLGVHEWLSKPIEANVSVETKAK